MSDLDQPMSRGEIVSGLLKALIGLGLIVGFYVFVAIL